MMEAVSPVIRPVLLLHAHLPFASEAQRITNALHDTVSFPSSSTLCRRKSWFLRKCVGKKASMTGITWDERSAFVEVFEVLKSELLNDPLFQWTDDARQWVDQMLDYNVPRGKLVRGLSVIDCYKSLKDNENLTQDELFVASVVGWCIEWIGASFLIYDDILDNSQTRRGQACWYKLPKVGNIAINDAAMIKNQVPRILKKHLREKPYYVDLLHLFDEVTYQSHLGEMMDLIIAIEGERDLLKYSLKLHYHIAKYKTSCYSFYLPVACALLLAGENLDNHVNVKDVLFDMGIYFQVVDDYLDCFGDPKSTGKIGTDIEDFKCSWLVLQALKLCNEEQKKILLGHYGKANSVDVAKIKAIYNDLNLQGVFDAYQTKNYDKLRCCAEAHPNKAVHAIWARYSTSLSKWL